MPLVVFVAVCCTNILFAVGVACLPMPDSGPYIANGWGQPVRLRHLYAARQGLHLEIRPNGEVDGSAQQSYHSLVEIRPVDIGCIAIKGVASSQFLCMERNGRLFGSHTYVKEDCSFKEHILPDGYNVYVLDKHGTLVSLGGKHKLVGRSRGIPALSQFLPMMSTFPLDQADGHPGEVGSPANPKQGIHSGLERINIDSFPLGKLPQIFIRSPSFNKR